VFEPPHDVFSLTCSCVPVSNMVSARCKRLEAALCITGAALHGEPSLEDGVRRRGDVPGSDRVLGDVTTCVGDTELRLAGTLRVVSPRSSCLRRSLEPIRDEYDGRNMRACSPDKNCDALEPLRS
jgi:hypothetical protein